jgi:hypothetical protein
VYGDVIAVSGFVCTKQHPPDHGWAVMGRGAAPGNVTLIRPMTVSLDETDIHGR